jgi:hypothetical protein
MRLAAPWAVPFRKVDRTFSDTYSEVSAPLPISLPDPELMLLLSRKLVIGRRVWVRARLAPGRHGKHRPNTTRPPNLKVVIIRILLSERGTVHARLLLVRRRPFKN